MTIVYKHEKKAILQSARHLLELNGIESTTKNEHSASAAGNLGISNSAAELWVLNSDDIEKAASIIEKDIMSAPTKPSWDCESCGEENDGSFELCWKCHAEPVDT